jgi:DNA-binding XRE family transcriptional regulator
MAKKDSENALIAGRIRRLRGELRQEDFALRLGYDQTTVSKWERGKARPTPEAMTRLAAMAKDDLDKLFFLEMAGLPEEYLLGKPMIPELLDASERVVGKSLSGAKGRPALPARVGRGSRTEPLDRDLVCLAMEVIDSQLKAEGRKLETSLYVELLGQIYDFCKASGRTNPQELRDMFAAARGAIHLLDPGASSDRVGKATHHKEDRHHHGRIKAGGK